jgi:hypothetical protein
VDPKDTADHLALEAQGPIPMDMVFRDPRSGAEMKYPGDRTGSAGPGDFVNCRCSWSADFSHLDDDKAAELGIRKDTTSVDLDGMWHEKASQQQQFERAMVRQLRFFTGMGVASCAAGMRSPGQRSAGSGFSSEGQVMAVKRALLQRLGNEVHRRRKETVGLVSTV